MFAASLRHSEICVHRATRNYFSIFVSQSRGATAVPFRYSAAPHAVIAYSLELSTRSCSSTLTLCAIVTHSLSPLTHAHVQISSAIFLGGTDAPLQKKYISPPQSQHPLLLLFFRFFSFGKDAGQVSPSWPSTPSRGSTLPPTFSEPSKYIMHRS